MIFAWAIGINITTTILFAEPEAIGGYGYTNKGLGYLYFTPIVAVLIGEVFGHFFNDYLARRYIKSHHGVFEPEARLWMIYISIGFMAPALILVGEALKWHLNVTAVMFGWGIFVFGCMTMSVALTAYTLDAYPKLRQRLGDGLTSAELLAVSPLVIFNLLGQLRLVLTGVSAHRRPLSRLRLFL
jgi:hypothetical protein